MRGPSYSSALTLGNTCMALIDVEEPFGRTANASRTEGFPPKGADVSPSSPRPRPLLRERNHCITLRALLELADIPCPIVSGARGTFSPSTACLSEVDVGSIERDWRSDGSREVSFSRDGVSRSRAELRPGRPLIVRVSGSTITLSVLRRLFFPLSGLSRDVCVAEASTVGLDDGDGATCNVDGRREVDPDIFEMVVYSEVAAELSDGARAVCGGAYAGSAGEEEPKILPRPILSMEMPLLCLFFLDEPEPAVPAAM